MQIKRAVGQGAGALKYDILSALLVMAAQGEATESRLALRLSLLMTARFDWRRERFNVGLRELARMWGVTERTAKRDMAQMRALNWISVARAAARGRVTEHRINLDVVLHATLPFWGQVGPDLVARLSQTPEPAPSNVVPLHAVPPPAATDETLWSQVRQKLHAANPQAYQAWFARLEQVDRTSTMLVLAAPTPFIATYVTSHYNTLLLTHVAQLDRSVTTLKVISVL